MIAAADLYKNSILTRHFGESKCFEVARALRELDLYPKRREVSIQEAANLLYCLAATPQLHVAENAYRAADELKNLQNTNGATFISYLSSIIKRDAFHSLKSIIISQKGGLAYIETVGPDMVFLDARRPGAGLDALNFHTFLPGNFLSAFAAIIKERNLTYENIN